MLGHLSSTLSSWPVSALTQSPSPVHTFPFLHRNSALSPTLTLPHSHQPIPGEQHAGIEMPVHLKNTTCKSLNGYNRAWRVARQGRGSRTGMLLKHASHRHEARRPSHDGSVVSAASFAAGAEQLSSSHGMELRARVHQPRQPGPSQCCKGKVSSCTSQVPKGPLHPWKELSPPHRPGPNQGREKPFKRNSFSRPG